jgi:hypothetical protein
MPRYQEALELARKAHARFPQEPVFEFLMSSACMRKMNWEANTGTPPWTSFEEGLAQAWALRKRFPDQIWAYDGLARLWVERAEYERTHGLDPRASVASALEALKAAEARKLRFMAPGWTEGDAYLIQGEYLLATRGGGEDDFQRAAAGFRKAFQANPNLREALPAMAGAMVDMAEGRLERGLDPAPPLVEAEANLERAGDNSVNSDYPNYLRGCIALLRGRQRLASGGDPRLDWARAEASFRSATAASGLAMAYVGWAEVRARAFLRSGRIQDKNQALAAARKALQRDPRRAEAWLWIAAVEQEALRRGERGAEPRAREAWDRALNLDANLGRRAKQFGKP